MAGGVGGRWSQGKQADQLALGEQGWGRNLTLKEGWRGEKSSDPGIFLKHDGHDVGMTKTPRGQTDDVKVLT